MKDRDFLLLCWMAYLNLPPLYASIIKNGGSVPVRALADYTLRMDAAGMLECVALNEAARNAAREMLGSSGVITGYINENGSDGFVAYMIEIEGITVVAMRGSEAFGECVSSNVDWVDNLCEPFVGSVQRGTILNIAKMFGNGKVVFTGHSKGGHNALMAIAFSENPDAEARAFNGQGFSAESLDVAQRQKVADRGINYVVADDIVGALLEHPEKRVFVRQAPETNAHMPEAFVFDENGEVVTAHRTLRSRAVELATRMIYKRLGANAKDGFRTVCRMALGGM